jgi:HSP20 family protein
MATFRWPGGFDPFSTLRYVQREMERLTGWPLADSQRVGGGSYPPVNIFEGPDEVVVQCEVAGVQRDDLDVSITGDTLNIRGVKKGPQDEERLAYQRRERGVGDFARTVMLPDKVDADRIDAKMEAGLLTIRLPKSEAARPRQIKVK